jgi:hypothetical protein
MDQLQQLERQVANAMLISEQLEKKVSAVQAMAETVLKNADAVAADFRSEIERLKEETANHAEH